MTALQNENFSANLPEIEITIDSGRKRVKDSHCSKMWKKGCLNKSCTAFKNINGFYYCIRK